MNDLEKQAKLKVYNRIIEQLVERVELHRENQYLVAFQVFNVGLFSDCNPKSAAAACHYVAEMFGGDTPSQKTVAALFDTSPQTIRKYTKQIEIMQMPEIRCPDCSGTPLQITVDMEWDFTPPQTVEYKNMPCKHCGRYHDSGSWKIEPY